LASQFLKTYSGDKRFSQKAWEWLKGQEWRGNVRELMSCVKRASILSNSSEIQPLDLKIQGGGKSLTEKNWLGGRTLDEAKDAFVTGKVQQALRLSSGNRTRAAELLGVAPRTLFRYLEDMEGMTDLSV
jgi:DNA-binding NtrC family response regulator